MIVKGKVHKFGSDVDTDVIIPARYLNTASAQELAAHCMEDIDPDFVKNVKAGGYILGDEGSGATMGKAFLSDLLKGLAPSTIANDFYDKFRINNNEVMESVYNRPFPNRFLSTVSYFLADHTSDEYVHALITTNLQSFFKRCVCQYDYQNYPIRFVGSVANLYSDILQNIATEFGATVDIIAESSMNGLIEFHALNLIEEP